MTFLLCPACRHAWTEPAPSLGARACDCDEAPILCSPWSSDGRAWYVARVQHKVADILDVLTGSQREKRRSIAKGIRRRGNRNIECRARP